MFSETRVVALSYLFGHEVLDRTVDYSELVDRDNLIDSQDNTCMPVMTETGQKLQAAFDFPTANVSREISAKVVVKNTSDCTAMMWTW